MNQAINFETLAFELDPEYQTGEFELENERGRRPLGRSSGQRQQPASQRNSRSTGYRSSAKKPRPRPRAPQKPWEIIRQPYGLVSNTYPAQNSFDSERVRWIQDSLNRILGLQLPVDGVMGAEVRSAIRSFQKQENLPVNGIVGPDTEQALMKASTSIPPSKQEEFEFFDTRLTDTEWEGEVNRSSPDYIRWVQTSLNKILAFRLAVDGISGAATRSAVRSFQQKKGLTADGIVGPITEAALISAGAAPPLGFIYIPYPSKPSTPTTPQAPSGLDLVSVEGNLVARQIATQLKNMLAAARADGVQLQINSAYRSPEKQIALRKQNCGLTHFDIYDKASSDCDPPTAKPGTSNHEKGLAVDIQVNKADLEGDPVFQWMRKNSERFGFRWYGIGDPVHWSIDGR